MESKQSLSTYLKKKFIDLRIKLIRPKYNRFEINSNEPKDLHFAFLGEFGYGLQVWLPYLKFLKENTPHRIHSHSAIGTKPFYHFTDSHTEHPREYFDITYGELLKYVKLEKDLGKPLIFPSNQTKNEIIINGFTWGAKKPRGKIDASCLSPLDFSHIEQAIAPSPYIVVNNKNYHNWNNDSIVNFFNKEDILELTSFINEKGYTLVYNAFPEPEEVENKYVEQNIYFNEQQNVIDMREVYKNIQGVEKRNIAQIGLYNGANFVVAVQGGNAVLPLSCKKDTYVLMRGGFDYPFYKTLQGIYGCKNECFYEPKHLLSYLKTVFD